MVKMIAGSWQLENEQLPYILLTKLATRPLEQYSCVSRLEESLFRFNIYGISSPEVESIITELETVYDYSSLNLSERIFNGIFWSGQGINELEPGIWQGIADYVIITKKEFSGDISTTVGNTIRDVVIKRAEESNLLSLVKRINLGFQQEQERYLDYPFISVLGFDAGLFDLSTCDRQEQVEYSFIILAYQLDQIEEIIEEIETIYDYCSFDINREVLINEWAGNNILEIEPGIWQAECNYTAILSG